MAELNRVSSQNVLGRRCAICQTSIAPEEAVGTCPECESPFHGECWEENGGCAIYGCSLVPQTVKGGDELPLAHWGQEETECPSCGESIKAAAKRCRFCGEMLADGGRDAASKKHTVSGGTTALVIFVAGIVPVTAPLALFLGGAWLLADRENLRRMSSFHRLLVVLGMIASGVCTVVIGGTLIVHVLTQP